MAGQPPLLTPPAGSYPVTCGKVERSEVQACHIFPPVYLDMSLQIMCGFLTKMTDTERDRAPG